MIKTGNRIFINKHDTCDQFPYQKIVITPKKYENSCEQIEMLKVIPFVWTLEIH